MPLLILLVGIALFNLLGNRISQEQTAVANSTAVPTQSAASLATSTRPPILQATILPSPTPSPTPLPPLPDSAAVSLLGPPPDSSLPPNGRLAFYWTYSEMVRPGQQFVLTLRQNEQVFVLGSVTHPNLGAGFQLLVDFGMVDIVAGTAVWQLHLEWANEQQQILSSEERTLIFLPE